MMESPACDYDDWDEEDLEMLDEYERQKILHGNPVFQYSSVLVIQYFSNSSLPVF